MACSFSRYFDPVPNLAPSTAGGLRESVRSMTGTVVGSSSSSSASSLMPTRVARTSAQNLARESELLQKLVSSARRASALLVVILVKFIFYSAFVVTKIVELLGRDQAVVFPYKACAVGKDLHQRDATGVDVLFAVH